MLDAPRHMNPVIQMVDELIRLHGRVRSIFAGVSAHTGLSSMESTVLAAVADARVAPTVPQIGRSLGHPRQVIQRAANALIAAGLVTTEVNPHHKRAPLLLPTARGLQVKKEADGRAVEAANALLETIDAGRCERLTRDLRRLRADIEAHLRAGEAG
jgi:DNA-binding MarR family transcriptional regulator